MWPGRPRLADAGGPSPARYRGVLGSNLRALWHASSGVSFSGGANISSWVDSVAGYALSPAGSGNAPTLATDGSNFRGKPCVQLAQSHQYLSATPGGLVAANGRPYMFAVYRYRATGGSYPYIVSLPSDLMVIYTLGAGQPMRGYVTANGVGVGLNAAGAQDTAQHFDELWLDGTNLNYVHDATAYTAANTGVVYSAIDAVQVGRSGEGAISTYVLGVCTVAPSAGQRAALAALIASDCV